MYDIIELNKKLVTELRDIAKELDVKTENRGKLYGLVIGIKDNICYANHTVSAASKMLERFLFTPREQQTKIEKLSGGEKRRLQLLKILMKTLLLARHLEVG